MKKFILSILTIVIATALNAQVYMAKECVIRFFAGTALEDIDATNTACKPALSTATGEVVAQVSIRGFIFENSLMQEHFNENYMESDIYPYAVFKGKVNELVDYSKDGVTKVTVSGKLTIHGVEKDRTLEGTITVKGAQIILDTKFTVKLADHNIKIPSAVGAKLAEEAQVTLNATLEPFKKK